MTTSEQRVRVGFGSVNLKNQSAKLAAFRVEAPYRRESAVSTGKTNSNWEKYPVSQYEQVNGIMYNAYTTHPNGTILMLQSSWTRGGSPIRDGAIYLRLRQEAAMLNVEARIPHGPDSRIGSSFMVFQGHADILSADDALVYKISTPHHVIDRFFTPEEVDECYEITQIIPESAPRPAHALVHTAQGAQVCEIAPTPQRRLTFRR